MLQKEMCIVLKKIRIHERDLMITALGSHSGRISAHAKNAVHSKRFAGSFDLFCLSEWEYMKKDSHEVVRVDRTEIKKSFSHLQKTWEQYSVASFFTELVLLTALPNESSETLFQLYINALLAVESSTKTDELHILTLSFLYKLLQWSGIQPILHNCYSCETKLDVLSIEALFLADAQQGGWLCLSCASTFQGKKNEKIFTPLPFQQKVHSFLNLTPQFIQYKDLQLLTLLGKTPIRNIPFDDERWFKNQNHRSDVPFEFLLSMVLVHSLHREPQHLKSLPFLPFLSSHQGVDKIHSTASFKDGTTLHNERREESNVFSSSKPHPV